MRRIALAILFTLTAVLLMIAALPFADDPPQAHGGPIDAAAGAPAAGTPAPDSGASAVPRRSDGGLAARPGAQARPAGHEPVAGDPPPLAAAAELTASVDQPSADARQALAARQPRGASPAPRVEVVHRAGQKYPLRRVVIAPDARGRDKRQEMVADHLLVRQRPGTTVAARERVLAALNARLRRRLPGSDLLLIAFDGRRPEALPRMRAALEATAWVAHAEPDYIVRHCGETDDPRYDELWGLENTGQTGGTPDADIDAPLAWRTTTGSDQVVVAVIDSGVDYTHEDLAANAWTNPGEIPGNGIDDDGNGFIDDVHGYDFYNDDGDPMDDLDHGTHCAGTIGAVADNGVGVVGVCPQVRLLGLKFLGADGSGATSDAILAFKYIATMVRDHGVPIRVSSNSWGGAGRSDELEAAIGQLADLGVLVVVAAGNSARDNDTTPHYPAAYELDNMLSVVATDHDDALAYFSNYGAEATDLGAPGVSILSTVPGDGYESFNGTSMATPHVSGAAALLFAADRDTATWQSVREALLAGVEERSSLAGRCVTGGRLNVDRSLQRHGVVPVALRVEDEAGGDGNGLANAGETIEVFATVTNHYSVGLTGVSLHLAVDAPESGIAVETATAACGDVSVGAELEATAVRLSLASDLATPLLARLRIRIDADQGSWTRVMPLPVGPSARVTGTVTHDGSALVDSIVHYEGTISGLSGEDAAYSGSVRSAGDGSYALALPHGSWQLQARYPGYLASDMVAVTVDGAAQTRDFAFTTVLLDGQVTDTLTSASVSGAIVAYDGPVAGSATTGGDGRYAFTEVVGRPADLTVTCSHSDYFTVTETCTVPPDTTIDFAMGVADIAVDPTAIAVELAPGEQVTVDLTIFNNGGAELTWSMRDQVHACTQTGGATPGTEVADLVQPEPLRSWYTEQGVGGIAAVGDELWVCGWYGSYDIAVLDPSDGSELRRIEDLPSDVVPYDLAYDGRLVWATSSWYDNYLVAIDPADGSVVRHFTADDLPGAIPRGIAYGDGKLWVSYEATDPAVANDRGGNRIADYTICSIDRENGAVLDTIVLSEELSEIPYRRLAWSGGALYICDTEANQIVAISADDGVELGRFADPWAGGDHFALGIAADDRGHLWLAPSINDDSEDAKLRLVDSGARPWLTCTPRAGAIAAVSSSTASVVIDTTYARAGVNTGTLSIGSNDLDTPHLVVPVTLTVTTDNRAPVFTADPASAANPVVLPATAVLSAAAADPDGDAITWHWYQSAGPGLAAIDDASRTSPTVTFHEPGDYTLVASVRDAHGARSARSLALTAQASGERRALTLDPERLVVWAKPGATASRTVTFGNTGWGPEGLSWIARDPERGRLLYTSPASVVADPYGVATDGEYHYLFHGGLAIEKHHIDGGAVDIIQMELGTARIKGYGLDYEDNHIWVAAATPRFAIFQVSLDTEQAVHTVDIPEGRLPTGVSLDPDGTSLWCLAYARTGDTIDYDDGMIYQLDRLTGDVLHAVALPASIPQDQGSVRNIVFIDGMVWVLRSYPNPEISPGKYKPLLYGVDPATGTVVTTFKPHSDKVAAICRGTHRTMWQAEYEIATFQRYVYQVVVDDVPWLRKDLEQGTIAAEGQQQVVVTCDGAVAGPGRHEAEITVFSDDPDTPVRGVPVVFFVSEHSPRSIIMQEVDGLPWLIAPADGTADESAGTTRFDGLDPAADYRLELLDDGPG